MEVIRSKVMGFCMGVRRAEELAIAEAQRRAGNGCAHVYTLGPLVHNPRVLSELKKRGVEYLEVLTEQSALPTDTAGELKNSTVIIRAHGISPALEESLRSSGCHVVDATCPNVKKSQLKAASLVEEGYTLFLAGDRNHSEIEGIIGYTGSKCVLVSNVEEAEAAAIELFDPANEIKTALLAQTTLSEEEYKKIGKVIKKYFHNLEVINTICAATADRQRFLRELIERVEAVIIAGGKESANTRRLFAIAQESGKPCILVEKAGEIPYIYFTYDTVGLCAGASTPDSVITEIELELLR